MPAQYVVGFDLGTTNSVLAYAPLNAGEPRLELLPITQLVAAGTAEPLRALPSFLYLAAQHAISGADPAHRVRVANSAPALPSEGDIYIDSVENALYIATD